VDISVSPFSFIKANRQALLTKLFDGVVISILPEASQQKAPAAKPQGLHL